MGMDTNGGYALVRALGRVLQRRIGSQHGIPKGILKKSLNGRDFACPSALFNFYARAGRMEPVMRGFNVILEPDELYVHREKLVFCRQKDGLGLIACDTGKDNPAVYRIRGGHVRKEKPLLEEFLMMLAFWQLSQGAFKYTGEIPEVYANQYMIWALEEDFEKGMDYDRIKVYFKPGQLVWFFGEGTPDLIGCEGDGAIHAAARTRRKFNELRSNYGFLEIHAPEGEEDEGEGEASEEAEETQ